jgi:hypothetical protein
MRVGPKNVTTLKDRLEEWHNRDSRVPYEKMKRIYNNYSDIEKQIFAHSNIKPEDITDESVAEIIKELKNFEI